MTNRTDIAEVLIDIEAQLRTLGLWSSSPPVEAALSSEQPFCVDTLTLQQWLQFVFLPTLYGMLDANSELPAQCGIAPMAEEYFRGGVLATKELEDALFKIDALLSAGGARPD